eukprot:SAG31_NODE_735_length_12488_cov_7.086044_16_plen_459_part_00
MPSTVHQQARRRRSDARLQALCNHLHRLQKRAVNASYRCQDQPEHPSVGGSVSFGTTSGKFRLEITPLVQHSDGQWFGATVTAASVDAAATCGCLQDRSLHAQPVDLSALGATQWQQIEAAWLEFALLVFPGQADLSPTDEVAFYQRFKHHDRQAPSSVRRQAIDGAPDIGIIGSARLRNHHGVTGAVKPGGARLQWHIDGYYDGDLPPAATQLYCVEAPPSGTGGLLQLRSGNIQYEGGATIFADTRYAYRQLPPSLRLVANNSDVQYWPGGLHGAWHAGTNNPPMDSLGLVPTQPPNLFDHLRAEDKHAAPMATNDPMHLDTAEDLGAGAFHDAEQANLSSLRAARHPLVWQHPETHTPAIMVHTLAMERLIPKVRPLQCGHLLAWDESQHLVRSMLAPCVEAEEVYVHNYKPGDLIIWDNFCSMHTKTPHDGYEGQRGASRLMHRLALNGSWIPK